MKMFEHLEATIVNMDTLIQNYLLQKSDKDHEAKELLKTMKRMGIE